MPRFVDDHDDDPEFSVCRPGIFESLVEWAQTRYAKSGDPRWRFRHPGEGDPPPNPQSGAKRVLDALEAGEPVVVPAWIARGHRWELPGHWSAERFELPWGREIRQVQISADDTVRPSTEGG